MIDKKRLQEIALVNKMPINQRVLQLLNQIQKEDPEQVVADDAVHLAQLLQWGIVDANLQVPWTNQDQMFRLLANAEERLSPQKLMDELTMTTDGTAMVSKEMLQGRPKQVASNLLEAWISKKIGQGIIWTTNDQERD